MPFRLASVTPGCYQAQFTSPDAAKRNLGAVVHHRIEDLLGWADEQVAELPPQLMTLHFRLDIYPGQLLDLTD